VTPRAFARSRFAPSGVSAKVTNASARNSRSFHLATNVSCCQCSSVPGGSGVLSNTMDKPLAGPRDRQFAVPTRRDSVPHTLRAASDGRDFVSAHRRPTTASSLTSARSRVARSPDTPRSSPWTARPDTRRAHGSRCCRTPRRIPDSSTRRHRGARPESIATFDTSAGQATGVRHQFLSPVVGTEEAEAVAVELRPDVAELRRARPEGNRRDQCRQPPARWTAVEASCRRTAALRRAARSAISPCRRRSS